MVPLYLFYRELNRADVICLSIRRLLGMTVSPQILIYTQQDLMQSLLAQCLKI